MIQVKQSNVKFKYNDSGNIKYSPLLDLLIVDHQSEYIDQAKNRIQGIVNQINNNSSVINNFCDGYASEQNYNVGDYVFYNGEMYRCTQDIQNSTETFPQEKFEKITVGNQLLEIKSNYLNRIDNLSNNLSEIYLSNKSYQVGDYCIKDDKLYQCFTMVEQAQNENWDDIKNNFKQIKIDEELKKLKNFKIKFSNWRSGQYGSSQTESEGALQRINKGVSRYDYYLGISCKQGDIFLIKKAKSHSNVRGYVFTKKDTDNYYWTYLANPNWCAPKDSEFTNLILTAPEGAEYLFVTFGISEDDTSWINDDRYATYYINPLAFQITKILENISSQYSEQKTYNVNDYCLYNGELYRCRNQVTNSSWDENSWIKTNISDELYYGGKTYTDNKIAQISSIINDAQAYAVGTRNGIPITDEDDPIYQRSAREYATNAGSSAAAAYAHLTQAKAWAIGEGINSTHQAYNNNSKYWANNAATSATNAAISAQQAQASKTQVESGIETWLYNNITQQTGYVLDSSLTSQNAAAQAKATGDAIANLQNIIASPYVSAISYNEGDYFTNNGNLYRVTSDITAVDNVNINVVSKTQINIGEDLSKTVWHEVQNLTTAQQSTARNNIQAADQMTVAFHTTQIDNLQSEKQDKLTFDSTPTAGSSNPVTSTGIKTVTDALSGDVDELKSALSTAQQYTGYWYQKLVIPANTAHQATSDRLDVDIQSGADYCIVCKMDGMYRPQFYAVYDDGTSERIYISASSTYWSFTIKRTASKHIGKLGVALTGTSSPQRTIELRVFTADSASWLFDYGSLTPYFIRRPDGLLCFERGRARADVDTLHQSIAVYDNQVWEFGEGKAAYNGVTYELANGHANCCNWGKELHGTYPYLYCPKTTDKNINIFSFDGSAFTLTDTITIASDVTGYVNAYVDDENGYIYGFIGADTYFVADMTGAILETKTLRYKILTIQNIKLHDGILYVVSGYGTQASPNYLSMVSTDGTMLGKYLMTGFGEIEGIDFLDNKMILATYYEFYINPALVPETKYFGYTNQLKATT